MGHVRIAVAVAVGVALVAFTSPARAETPCLRPIDELRPVVSPPFGASNVPMNVKPIVIGTDAETTVVVEIVINETSPVNSKALRDG